MLFSQEMVFMNLKGSGVSVYLHNSPCRVQFAYVYGYHYYGIRFYEI